MDALFGVDTLGDWWVFNSTLEVYGTPEMVVMAHGAESLSLGFWTHWF